MENYYKILGISFGAGEHTIKKAYRTLAKQYHPDSPLSKELPDAEEKFKLIKEGYETLINKESRKTYNKYILKKVPGLSVAEEGSYVNKAVAYYERGRELYKTKKFNSASRVFQSALNLDQDNALYCSWFGMTLSHIPGRLQGAKKWCEKAIKLSPHNSDYYINLAIVYKDAGVPSMAERLFRKAFNLNPDNQRAHLWLKDKNKKFSFRDLLKNIFGQGKK